MSLDGLSSRTGMSTIVTDVAGIGFAVREARQALGLRQDVLAAAAGVGPRFVVDLEAGKSTVQMDKVFAVLSALRIDVRLDGS